MKINEYFKAIQGEGICAGLPVYFIRLSGCNTECNFCDSKYHKLQIYNQSVESVADRIRKSNLEDVVITGGEPMLQIKELDKLFDYLPSHTFHLETNGSIYNERMKHFRFIVCSPKKQQIKNNLESYKKINQLPQSIFKFVYENSNDKWWEEFSEKVGIRKNKIMIMPKGKTRNEQVKLMPEVIEYCLENKIKFSPRLHILAFNNIRGK